MSFPTAKVLQKTRREQEEDWTGTQLYAADRLPMPSATPWMQESVSMNARKCVHECKKVCPWMQESVSMNARKRVHAQKPYPSQAFAHESSKVGGRGKRETGKTEARRLMERKAKQKHTWGTKTRPPGTDRLTKQGEGNAWLALATECHPLPPGHWHTPLHSNNHLWHIKLCNKGAWHSRTNWAKVQPSARTLIKEKFIKVLIGHIPN